MTDYGVIKSCVFLVTFMGCISRTNTVLTNKEARLLNHKIELIKTGFDSKLLTALMDIEDLQTKGTCTCMESNQTDTENIVEEPDQKKTNKLDGSNTQSIRRDGFAILTRGFVSEKKARKYFEIKTELLIQEKGKKQQDQINKLKNNIDVELNNTLGLQRDKFNQLMNIDVEMNNTLGLQLDKLNQLTNFDVEMNNTLGIQRDEANKVSAVFKEMDKTITEQRGEIDRLNEIVNDMSNTIDRMKKSATGCTEPASINYGTVNYFGTNQGSIVRYTCEDGYSMKGENKRKCLSTGQWNVEVPLCVQVTCPKLTLESGEVTYDNMTVGGTATFVCDTYNTMEGVNQTQCLPMGKWDGEIPTCVPVTCPKLTLRLGTVTYEKLTVDSTATFSCDVDYTMEGVNQTQCLPTGKWNDEPPICVQVTCPKLTLESGTVTYDTMTVGGTATFVCDTYYTMEGVNQTQCLPTGKWDGETHTCVPAYGPPLAAAMYKGARVMRGRDWKWKVQDGHGPGTVIGKHAYVAGWIQVQWDNGLETYYRKGYQESYDVMFVPGTYDISKAGKL